MSVEQQLIQQQLEEAKSSYQMGDLPCGYLELQTGMVHQEVTVREINGDDEDMLGAKNVPPHRKMAELLIRCITRLGPYSGTQQIAPIVPELVIGDQVYLLFLVRRASLGDMYPFKETCPECSEERLYSVDLSTLDVKKSSDPRVRSYDFTLPRSGKKVRFHPLLVKQQAELTKAQGKADAISRAMYLRLELFDGRPAMVNDLKALGMADRKALRKQFEKVEGGVETTFQVVCTACNHEFDREVDPTDEGFFSPEELENSSTSSS